MTLKNFKELYVSDIKRWFSFYKRIKLFRIEKDLTISKNLILQLLDLDVMMEVVALAVAKPQINVQLMKETATRILTAKII